MTSEEFGKRFHQIRGQILRLTLQEVGQELGVGKSQISQVESGKVGLGPDRLFTFIELHKDQFDVRYLFGQLDDISQADLKNVGGTATLDNVVAHLVRIDNKISPPKGKDAVADHVVADQVLRRIVTRLISVQRRFYPLIEAYIEGIGAKIEEIPDVEGKGENVARRGA